MDSVQHASISASSSSSSSASSASRTIISTTPNPWSSTPPSTLPSTTLITHRHSYPTNPLPPTPPSPSTGTPLKTHRHLSFHSFTTPFLPPLNVTTTTTRRLSSSQWAQLSSQFERIDSLASRRERVVEEELRMEGVSELEEGVLMREEVDLEEGITPGILGQEGLLLSFPFPPKRKLTPPPFEVLQDIKKDWQPLTPPTSPTRPRTKIQIVGIVPQLVTSDALSEEQDEDRSITHGRTKLHKIDHGQACWSSSVPQEGQVSSSSKESAILTGDRKRLSELLVALEG